MRSDAVAASPAPILLPRKRIASHIRQARLRGRQMTPRSVPRCDSTVRYCLLLDVHPTLSPGPSLGPNPSCSTPPRLTAPPPLPHPPRPAPTSPPSAPA